MKRLFVGIFIALSLLVCNDVLAQESVKHIVKKGETITSIADDYNVTVDDIIKLNPKAERFLFVGMELMIPRVDKVSQNKAEIGSPAKFRGN